MLGFQPVSRKVFTKTYEGAQFRAFWIKKPVSYMGTIKAHFLKSPQSTEQEISCFVELCSLPLSELYSFDSNITRITSNAFTEILPK
jgi:hypothetical protein